METERLPWFFGLVTGVWFAWMATRAGGSRALWAVGGGAFGVVVSTLVIGLGRARTISFSPQEDSAKGLGWALAAAILIAVAGWALTSGLHRRRLMQQSQGAPPATAKDSASKTL